MSWEAWGDDDDGTAYRAHIITKPYIVAGLLNKWGAMAAALLALPNADATLTIRLIRDFGLETNEVTTDFIPDAAETDVIKIFDNLVMSDARAIQVEFQDPNPVEPMTVAWQLYEYSVKPRAEQRA